MLPKKKAEENYIQYKRTITMKEQLEMITLLSNDWMIPPTAVITRIIDERLAKERDKRQEVKSYTSGR